MRVLLIEDNREMAELTRAGLARRGINADLAHDLNSADQFLKQATFDVIMLDLGMPDGDGVDWLRQQPHERPPVLILSARHTLTQRVLGLDSGADDYLVKPAEVEEIAARLRALQRRPGNRNADVLERGSIALNCHTRQVVVDSTPVLLGRRETELLETLLRYPGVVARETIEGRLYGLAEAVTPNALEALTSRLRRRLAEAGAGDVLHTVRGLGYYLGDGKQP